MGRHEQDAHDQANAGLIARLKADPGLLEPWAEADDDVPLADLRPSTPDDALSSCSHSGAQNRPCTVQTSMD